VLCLARISEEAVVKDIELSAFKGDIKRDTETFQEMVDYSAQAEGYDGEMQELSTTTFHQKDTEDTEVISLDDTTEEEIVGKTSKKIQKGESYMPVPLEQPND